MAPASAVGPARVIEAGHADYPPELLDLAEPPERLFLAGALGSLDRAVAIVGTRRASPDARDLARTLGRALADEGCLVVSGAAQGIDGEAHAGALDRPDAQRPVTNVPATGSLELPDPRHVEPHRRAPGTALARGGTLAVLATPLDAPYPTAHVPLLRSIVLRGGGVLTEAPPGAPTFRASFLHRNRIVAALARAVVVVEAPVRSGTLSTVHHALALGRPIFAVPWSPLDEHRAGGVALLGRGEARACRDARDIVDALGWSRRFTPRDRRNQSGPGSSIAEGSVEARVLHAVGNGASHVDAVVDSAGVDVADAQIALLSLVLAGRVLERDGRYRPAR